MAFSAPGDLWGGLGADLVVGGIKFIEVVTRAWHARGPSRLLWCLGPVAWRAEHWSFTADCYAAYFAVNGTAVAAIQRTIGTQLPPTEINLRRFPEFWTTVRGPADRPNAKRGWVTTFELIEREKKAALHKTAVPSELRGLQLILL